MIRGAGIVLRAMTAKDLDRIIDLSENVLEVGDFWTMRIPNRPKFEKRFLETGFWEEEEGVLLIVDRIDDRLLGTIGFFKASKYGEGFEIGYRIFNAADRRKGIMTEALKLFSAYLFDLNKIERLTVCTHVDNAASAGVALKCGFRQEGIMRRAWFLHGEYADLRLFSLLRDECPAFRDVLAEISASIQSVDADLAERT